MSAIPKTKETILAPRPNKFWRLLVIYAIYSLAIIHTYDFQIAEANAYAGMRPWEMSGVGWMCAGVVSCFVVFISARLKGNPSDFFVILYSAIPLTSFLTLSSTSGKINAAILLPALIIITFPLVSVLVVKRCLPNIKWRGFFSHNVIDKLILGILLFTVGYSYFNSPESASFDIASSYDRRLEGREIYRAGSVIAYSLAMSVNGFAPYLAFRGIMYRKGSLICIAFGAVIFFYWLLGLKAPIAYVLLACIVGYLIRRNYLANFAKYFLLSVIALYLLVLIEWLNFDGYSLISNYVFRRLFSVQSQIQGYYLDVIMINSPGSWSLFWGGHEQSLSASYYIGAQYMGNPDLNANTNAFLYAFVENGVLGYLVAAFFVAIFLGVLDRLYQTTRHPTYLLIGFIYGYLITEQAFSTALVSSGVGLLFLLSLLERVRYPLTNGNSEFLRRN